MSETLTIVETLDGALAFSDHEETDIEMIVDEERFIVTIHCLACHQQFVVPPGSVKQVAARLRAIPPCIKRSWQI